MLAEQRAARCRAELADAEAEVAVLRRKLRIEVGRVWDLPDSPVRGGAAGEGEAAAGGGVNRQMSGQTLFFIGFLGFPMFFLGFSNVFGQLVCVICVLSVCYRVVFRRFAAKVSFTCRLTGGGAVEGGAALILAEPEAAPAAAAAAAAGPVEAAAGGGGAVDESDHGSDGEAEAGGGAAAPRRHKRLRGFQWPESWVKVPYKKARGD